MFRIILGSVLSCLLFLPTVGQAQVLLGQIDNFQDGTLQGWTNGPVGDPVNQPNGGPLGAGDRYLEVSSGALGGGARIIVFNRSQWIGNFNAPGIARVEMDLKNFTASALSMQLAFRSGTGGSATPGYTSTVPFSLPADGLWHHVGFDLNPAKMTAINSPAAFVPFFQGVAEMRILHATAPSLIGDAGDFRFGVDNIRAVPEPGVLLLGSIGAAIALGAGRRYAKSRRQRSGPAPGVVDSSADPSHY